ncbi:GA-like domain-containing protein, partial [Gallibacterium anatis]|uniref:GA-like domain-containing protein n=1 Tax=Gallibacterium anatis TaxID=750 RepID=UPI003A4FB6F2
GNPSTDPKPTTPPDAKDDQGDTGSGKPGVSEQTKNAKKLVKAAEDAETKAEEALKEAKKDGVISQEEKGKLDSLNEEITKAKKDAEDALKDLPNGKDKDDLKERLDNVNVPTVNDSNGNGVDDATDVANAEKALNDAEAAKKAFEDKKVEAGKAISSTEQQELEQLKQDYDAKKADA